MFHCPCVAMLEKVDDGVWVISKPACYNRAWFLGMLRGVKGGIMSVVVAGVKTRGSEGAVWMVDCTCHPYHQS